MTRRLLALALMLAAAAGVMAADTAVKSSATLATPAPPATPAGAQPAVNVPADAVHLVFLGDPRPTVSK